MGERIKIVTCTQCTSNTLVSFTSILGTLSEPMHLDRGMPQGSLIGPQGYTRYVSPLFDIAQAHNVSAHMYADDTQLYIEFDVDKWQEARSKMEQCISDMRKWLRSNSLKLNEDKTEIMIVGQPHKIGR